MLAAVLLGGAGNIGGAILGGFLVIYVPEWLRSVGDVFGLPETGQRRRRHVRRQRDLAALLSSSASILIVMMIFRPQGLWPNRRRAAELKDREKEVAPSSEPSQHGRAEPTPRPASPRIRRRRVRRRAQGRLLEVDNVTLRFGGVVALNQVNFTLYEGEILGLIGPNGAGKTTCFNAMTGVYRPTEGEIRFKGEQAERPASATRSPRWASPGRSRTSGSSPR